MKYYYILSVCVILAYQIHRIIKLNIVMKNIGESISTYKHQSAMGGIYLVILFQFLIKFDSISKENIVLLLWLSPLVVVFTIGYYKNSRKIELYDAGLLVFGDFVNWDIIENVKLEKKEIQVITAEDDPKYYTISNLNNSTRCYNEIIGFVPKLAAHNMPVNEITEPSIKEFLK